MDIIEKAIEVATKAHDGQYRKTTGIPYIVHPFSVGLILLKNRYPDEIIAAGILHDTVEDTSLTLDDIRNQFGNKIADLVQGASEENKQDTWEERKRATIEFLETAPKDVCIVVCADKLHNIRSIRKSIEMIGEKTWDHFKRGRDKQEWYYRGVVKQLEKKLKGEGILNELIMEVEHVFH